jgi:electron transfer flavoprotein-quinone oxidoreductase
MADFDAIVVGAGCAGSVAAYELAQSGRSVLLVERGDFAGAKNMTGGRLYTHSLARVFPNYQKTAPLERQITHERISMMAPDANMTIDFNSQQLAAAGHESYSVLRASFDQWLAEQAEAAGAECIYGITVEELLKEGEEGGRVTGIKAGGDEVSAEVVILADGCNSLLTAQAVGASRPRADQMAVGVKQVIGLPADAISERLLVDDGQGAAWLFVGDVTKGQVGGGFVYTNKESISIGVIATIATLALAQTPIYQMLEDFKQRPEIAPLLRGGEPLEHSGHMVPEGGFRMMPPLVGNGVLLAGESAMLCVNLGYQVRGMDYAIAAGQQAGLAVDAALEAGDTSASGLAGYKAALRDSFVLQDLEQFQRFPHYLEQTSRLFNEYPALARDLLNSLFVVDGQPVRPLKQQVRPLLGQVGLLNILKDARGALKSL